jgi:hypothetical protein
MEYFEEADGRLSQAGGHHDVYRPEGQPEEDLGHNQIEVEFHTQSLNKKGLGESSQAHSKISFTYPGV